MARSEARIAVDIWDDGSDFLTLSRSAQGMYMFLLSQRDISHAGVLALRERRWSRKAAGMKTADVTRDLEELAAARYVVIDEDTEELLVRSFVRRDKVYRQPNVLLSAADSLPLIASPVIRQALAVELRRVAIADDLGERSAEIVAKMLEELEKGSGMPTPDPSDDESAGDEGSGNPSENPSENPRRGAPGDRGMVTAVSKASPSPVPLSPNPDGSSPYIGHPARVRDLEPPQSDEPMTLTEQIMLEYREESPNGVSPTLFAQLAEQVHELLAADFKPDHIREGLKRLRPRRLGPKALPSVVDGIANAPQPSNVVALRGDGRPGSALAPAGGAPGTPDHFARAMERAKAREGASQ